MLGAQEDWDKMVVKFQKPCQLLKPIHRENSVFSGETTNGSITWKWSLPPFPEKTFAESKYSGGMASQEVADFWMKILMQGKGIKYGGSGMAMGSVPAYHGWLVKFLLGYDEILAESISMHKGLSGLNEVRMKITATYEKPPLGDVCQLQSGMVCTSHQDASNQVPSVQPHQSYVGP